MQEKAKDLKQQLTEMEARADELEQNLKSKQMECDKLEGVSQWLISFEYIRLLLFIYSADLEIAEEKHSEVKKELESTLAELNDI